MSKEEMRDQFETRWGQTNDEQGLYFIPELSTYGCELAKNRSMADRKSSAWYYFQLGQESALAATPKADAQPAAWIKPDVLATLRGDECCYAFGEQSPKGNLVPLFTRSDAGEVERLNTVVEHLKREAKNDAIAYKAAIERQDEIRAERDQLKAENEVLRNDAFFHRHTQRQAELYQNVQMAAGSLPDGWQVVIEIERDAGTVSLLDGDGEAVDEEFGDSGDLADQVAEALKYAVSKEGEQ